MSDIENKTDSTAETPATNTAPYMKKADDKPAATKSNFVIPIILLLVSIIVIVATFYEDEYNTLIAELNAGSNEDSEAVIISTSEDAGVNGTVNSSNSADVRSSATTEISSTEETATEEVRAVVISEESGKSTAVATDNKKGLAQNLSNSDRSMATAATDNDKETSESAQVNQDKTALQLASKTAVAQVPAFKHNAYQQSRNPQAQKHHEMMQQRRQTYKAEMQARREQHKATMKARHEQRAAFYETQKAVFQRTQNKRVETAKQIQQIQQIHQKIEVLHDELHQLMQQHHVSYTAPSSQITNQSAEHM